MKPLFRTEDGTLLVRMPAQGIDPSWLARPLAELGLPPSTGVSALQVVAADDWRWGSAEAAFLARILDELRSGSRELALAGVPPELEKLLALSCASPRAAGAGATNLPGFVARVGLRARHDARELRAFMSLLGEVILLPPRFATARAKVRGAEVLEVLAEAAARLRSWLWSMS